MGIYATKPKKMTKSVFSQEEIHSNFENNYYDEYDFMQIKDIKIKEKTSQPIEDHGDWITTWKKKQIKVTPSLQNEPAGTKDFQPLFKTTYSPASICYTALIYSNQNKSF